MHCKVHKSSYVGKEACKSMNKRIKQKVVNETRTHLSPYICRSRLACINKKET